MAIRIGDIGVNIDVRFINPDGSAKDISSAGTLEIHFKKPDGTLATETAAFIDDGSDGWIRWTNDAAGDWDQRGTWKYYGNAVASGTFDITTESASLEVLPRYE